MKLVGNTLVDNKNNYSVGFDPGVWLENYVGFDIYRKNGTVINNYDLFDWEFAEFPIFYESDGSFNIKIKNLKSGSTGRVHIYSHHQSGGACWAKHINGENVMNIVLTDEQFNQVKDDIIKNLESNLKVEISRKIDNYIKNFSTTEYENGEIRNKIKNEISQSLSNKIINKININSIEEKIERQTNKRVQSALNEVLKGSINVTISGNLVLDN